MPSARETARELRDFTVTARVIPISLLAIGIGVLGAFVALALMWLIGLFTNLFFFERWSTALIAPAGNHLGGLVVLVPVLGGLVVGLIARYGSEKTKPDPGGAGERDRGRGAPLPDGQRADVPRPPACRRLRSGIPTASGACRCTGCGGRPWAASWSEQAGCSGGAHGGNGAHACARRRARRARNAARLHCLRRSAESPPAAPG